MYVVAIDLDNYHQRPNPIAVLYDVTITLRSIGKKEELNRPHG